MFTFDNLKSIEFEEFCFDLLTALGFININWRKGTGLESSPSDFGRDIECQFKRVDIDGKVSLERWFVESKHYRKGVPPTKLTNALAWAEANNIDTLLIIVSNYLSNPAKEYLEKYEKERKPKFNIKVWEKPDLERLTTGKAQLLRKYGLVGDFPFLTVIHPAHALYMHSIPLNTLSYLFSILDDLESDRRNMILSWITIAIVKGKITGYYTDMVFGRTITIPEYDHNARNYEEFKNQCYRLAKYLDEQLIVYLIVNWVLQCQLRIGDITSVDEFIQRQRESLEWTEGEFKEKFVFTEDDRKWVEELITHYEESIDNAHENATRNYTNYVWFCEKVVAPLLQEKYQIS